MTSIQPDPEEPSPVKRIVAAAKARAEEDQQAELRRLRALLHLDEHATKAQEHVDYIAGRATEISGIQKACEIAPSDEATILATRPGLGIYFTALHAAADDLTGQTFGTQSILQKALGRYHRLTPEDTIAPPGRFLIQTPFGPVSPQISSVWETLANRRALADINTAVEVLIVAHGELMERLASAV